VTRSQRIILVLYGLLVAYCCIWVPWVANLEGIKDVHQGYGWIWSPPTGTGVPSLVAIVTRIGVATGLSAAAFVAARRWKLLLLTVLALAAGFGTYDYWTMRAAEKQASRIDECAVAKVASEGCDPPIGEFQVCNGYYAAFHNASPGEESAIVLEAEKECAAEIKPGPRSAHDEIEEYRRQHRLKQ